MLFFLLFRSPFVSLYLLIEIVLTIKKVFSLLIVSFLISSVMSRVNYKKSWKEVDPLYGAQQYNSAYGKCGPAWAATDAARDVWFVEMVHVGNKEQLNI